MAKCQMMTRNVTNTQFKARDSNTFAAGLYEPQYSNSWA